MGSENGTDTDRADAPAAWDEHVLLDELRTHRRALHRIPELGFDLSRTLAYIERALEPLTCEVSHPCPSCICAFFDCGAKRAVAIRADMDALPITEATGCNFASEHEGCMHACGHDAHMAMVLACASALDRELRGCGGSRAEAADATDAAHAGVSAPAPLLPRNVLFVFQPAEETTGGAKTVCESGVFERYRVDCIFGFHVWPDLPTGVVASRPGPLLARSSETHVHIQGASTHIAKTYGVADADSHDAALAAAQFLVESRRLMELLNAEEPCICRFGQVKAGTVCNAVAGEAHLAGSLRVFSDAMFARAKAGLREVLERACVATGCAGEIDFAEGYPPVTNDEALFARVERVLPELMLVDEPLLIAEDFAFYQRHLPGVFFLLGVGEPDERGAEKCEPDKRSAAPAPDVAAVPGFIASPSSDAASASSSDLAVVPDSVPAVFDAGLGVAHSALHTDTFIFDERILLQGVSTYNCLIHAI